MSVCLSVCLSVCVRACACLCLCAYVCVSVCTGSEIGGWVRKWVPGCCWSVFIYDVIIIYFPAPSGRHVLHLCVFRRAERDRRAPWTSGPSSAFCASRRLPRKQAGVFFTCLSSPRAFPTEAGRVFTCELILTSSLSLFNRAEYLLVISQ